MKLGEMLGWADNDWYKLFDSNRNMITGAAGGALANPNNPWGGAAMGVNQGAQADDAAARLEAEEQKRLTQINQTATWLREQGAADLADAVDGGFMDSSDAFSAWSTQRQAQVAQDDAMQRARANAQFLTDPNVRAMVEAGALSFEDGLKYQTSGQMPAGRGTTIYTGRDVNGQIVPMQVGEDGQFYPTAMPDGVSFDPGALSAERASGTKVGAGAGQAAFDLPTVEAQTEFAINNLNGLIFQTDQTGQVMTGPLGQPVPNQGMQEQFGTGWGGLPTGQMLPAFPNSEKANFQARREQVQGQAFLQAIDSLKGSGAVSEVEGLKATQAIIRAQTSQTEAEFVKAIQEAIGIYERGLATARQQAAGTQFSSGATQGGGGQFAVNPQTGERLMLQNGQWVPAP